MGGQHRPATREGGRVGFAEALRHRTFGTVFLAETQSVIGDQLARIALSFLVFDASGSPALTAGVYAVTFLPAVVGGLLLTGTGDALSRRNVMVGVDVLRAMLFAVMALPAVPLQGVTALLVITVLVGPVFTSAAVALLADTMSGDQFRAGTGLRMAANQAAQVIGFGVGGALVAGIGPRGALAVNAVTFGVSALLVMTLPRGTRVGGGSRSPATPTPRRGTKLSIARLGQLARIPGVAWLMALSALTGAFVVPEGLAVPFGAEIGATTGQVGLLLAAIPLGTILGVATLVYVLPVARRPRAMRAMCVASGVPLVLLWFRPGVGLALALLLVAGFFTAYVMETMTALMAAVPRELRSGLVGVSSAVMLGAQGAGLALFGLVAGLVSAAVAIGVAGLVGVASAVVLLAAGRRSRRRKCGEANGFGSLSYAAH